MCGADQAELMTSIKTEIADSGLESCPKTKELVYLAQIFLESSQWAQRGSVPEETMQCKHVFHSELFRFTINF